MTKTLKYPYLSHASLTFPSPLPTHFSVSPALTGRPRHPNIYTPQTRPQWVVAMPHGGSRVCGISSAVPHCTASPALSLAAAPHGIPHPWCRHPTARRRQPRPCHAMTLRLGDGGAHARFGDGARLPLYVSLPTSCWANQRSSMHAGAH
jgi:hypothetical protein